MRSSITIAVEYENGTFLSGRAGDFISVDGGKYCGGVNEHAQPHGDGYIHCHNLDFIRGQFLNGKPVNVHRSTYTNQLRELEESNRKWKERMDEMSVLARSSIKETKSRTQQTISICQACSGSGVIYQSSGDGSSMALAGTQAYNEGYDRVRVEDPHRVGDGSHFTGSKTCGSCGGKGSF